MIALPPGPGGGIAPGIAGVSETMLWSLHNRAIEAVRPDGVLKDPDSVRIHAAIDYDFAGRFGEPSGSLAARSAEIDRALRTWLAVHPMGTIISLGEGLETQAQRVDNGRMQWLTVDLPDAIRLRERFLPPTERFRHIAASALDPVWMDAVDPAHGVFIVAQGLLMYLPAEAVRQLVTGIADRFPGCELIFDAIPRWFSRLTVMGLKQTAQYRLPDMPWGINRDEIAPTLRAWHPSSASVAFLPYQSPRGSAHLWSVLANRIPVARHGVPSLVHVIIASDVSTNRKPHMTLNNESDSLPAATNDLMAAAERNARCGNDIAVASGKVIAKRMALGMAASRDPLGADPAEFTRMLAEKVEAFSAAGLIVLKQSGEAGHQVMRAASAETLTAARAVIAMTDCRDPVALAEAQGAFARAWFARATSNWIALGIQILAAQSATMAPIRQTVVANAERFGL